MALALGSLTTAVACSLIVDTNAKQCSTDHDCAVFGSNRMCTQGLCVVRADAASPIDAGDHTDAGGPCNANTECGDGELCKNHVCERLTSAVCPEVLGNYKDPNAVIFGAIIPEPLRQAPDYLRGLSKTAVSMRDGLALALDDFASDQNPYKGLPPKAGSSGSRPIAFVVCGDDHADSATVEATNHLANDVHVPAIVGTAFGTFTRSIATALANGGHSDVLLVAPRSSDLTAADNGGNAWNLALPNEVQGIALSALVAKREPLIRAQVPGGAQLKVGLVWKEDAYGQAVADAVKATLKFNGGNPAANGANFREFRYGNSDDANYTPQFAATAAGIALFSPHILIVAGTNEAASTLIPSIENGWSASYRPRYFLSDGLLMPDLSDYLAGNDPTGALRARILGTTPATSVAAFNSYHNGYAAKYTDGQSITSGASAYYDAVYLLAYSAAALGSVDVTGPNLVQGFGQLRGGGGALAASVGPANISATFARLAAGQTISLDGVSVPLRLDPTTHAVTGGTAQVWCIPSSGTAGEAILSGQFVDATGTVQGSFTSACSP